MLVQQARRAPEAAEVVGAARIFTYLGRLRSHLGDGLSVLSGVMPSLAWSCDRRGGRRCSTCGAGRRSDGCARSRALSIHEIVRRTGHDRNTVRRALRREGPPRNQADRGVDHPSTPVPRWYGVEPDGLSASSRVGVASLLLHEGNHVIYVARQLGHDSPFDANGLRPHPASVRGHWAYRPGGRDSRSASDSRTCWVSAGPVRGGRYEAPRRRNARQSRASGPKWS